MNRSSSEALVKQVFPVTANETRAREHAKDIYDALYALRKRYRGHTIKASQLRLEVEDILAEGLMAHERLCEKNA